MLKKPRFLGAEAIVYYQLSTDLFIEISEMELPLRFLDLVRREDFQFVIAFVLSKAEIGVVSEKILRFLHTDSMVWFCFP